MRAILRGQTGLRDVDECLYGRSVQRWELTTHYQGVRLKLFAEAGTLTGVIARRANIGTNDSRSGVNLTYCAPGVGSETETQ